jgi:serine protease AprX
MDVPRKRTLMRAARAAGSLLIAAAALVGFAGAQTTPAQASVPPVGKWLWEGTATSMASAIASVRADKYLGMSGKDIGIALIDTGVAPVAGLTGGNVVNGADLSFDSQDPAKRYVDGYGHGTHLAGIIGGRSTGKQDEFKGVAPSAKIVSVKVGASNGAVDVSQVIAGIDWVVAHRADDPFFPIKILTLAYGTDGVQSYQLDPLAHAVENAWRAGITVVVAGGNNGSAASLSNPAIDPYVIAVGAADTNNTVSASDDSVASFTSLGNSARGLDVIAPGRSIISLRAPGSYADVNYPAARVGTNYFRGSGSSQAAALVAGVAALLLENQPYLTPDQVKGVFKKVCSPVGTGAAPRGCMLNLMSTKGAGAQYLPAQSWPASTGTGTLEGARGSIHLADGASTLTGENDIFGPFSTATWAAASTKGTAWNGGAWMGRDVTGTEWVKAGVLNSWAGRAWSGRAWSGRAWSDVAWASASWQGKAWS